MSELPDRPNHSSAPPVADSSNKTRDQPAPDTPESDIRKESFEKDHQKVKNKVKGEHRSMMNAPVDPNSPTTKVNFPPGLEAEDAADPGRATPNAPPVVNRSGSSEDSS